MRNSMNIYDNYRNININIDECEDMSHWTG